PRSAMDTESPAKRIEALRAKLAEENLPGFFSSVDALKAAVGTAVHNWSRARASDPGIGGAARDTIAGKELAGYRKRLQRYARLDLNALTPPQGEEYLQTPLQSVFIEPDVQENPPPLDREEERVREASKGKPPRRVLSVL